MFQIGDFVRVIPCNYDHIHKNFNVSNYWYESNSITDEHVMLGGKYRILDLMKENTGNNIFYSVLPHAINYGGHVTKYDLSLDKDIKDCPFKVGDRVRLDISDEEARLQYFPLADKNYAFFDRKKIFKVTAVLNKFYIFLNYEKDSINSAPFRWDNFKEAL